MATERWHPFTDLMSLRQAMDRLFEDSFVRPSRALAGIAEVGAPALDIYQAPDEIVVKGALPGLKPEDVSIDITGDTLTIKGESKAEQEIRREDYLYQERPYGAFSRTVILPWGAQVKQGGSNDGGPRCNSHYTQSRRSETQGNQRQS